MCQWGVYSISAASKHSNIYYCEFSVLASWLFVEATTFNKTFKCHVVLAFVRVLQIL